MKCPEEAWIISDGTENRIRGEVRGKYEIAGVKGSKKGSVNACQGELVQHDSFWLTRPSFHTSRVREPSTVFEEGDWRVPKRNKVHWGSGIGSEEPVNGHSGPPLAKLDSSPVHLYCPTQKP